MCIRDRYERIHAVNRKIDAEPAIFIQLMHFLLYLLIIGKKIDKIYTNFVILNFSSKLGKNTGHT